MDFAHAIRQTNGYNALTTAVCQFLLLIALGYATSFIVPACISLACGQIKASPQVNEPPHLNDSAQSTDLPFSAELCSTAIPEFGRPSPCETPK
jgi:hypothetical protein